MEAREMICIVCPMGCKLEVMRDKTSPTGYTVTGQKCPRGESYGVTEMVNPTRALTSTVKIKKGFLPRLPVRTNGAIPKGKIFQVMELLNTVEVEAPVAAGQVIIKDVLETGIDIIASRSMDSLI